MDKFDWSLDHTPTQNIFENEALVFAPTHASLLSIHDGIRQSLPYYFLCFEAILNKVLDIFKKTKFITNVYLSKRT